MNKGIKIAIIILIVVILILSGGFVYIYYCTDMLKTDKQLFFKYSAQSQEILQSFSNEKLTQYFNEKETVPYKNNLTFNLKQEIENGSSLTIGEVTSEGIVDLEKEKIEQKLNIKLSDNTNEEINYKQSGNIYGIKMNNISDKYYAVQNKDLKKLAKSMEMNAESIPDTIDFDENNIENLKSIINLSKQKYLDIINNNLNEENFSNEVNGDNKYYILKISAEQIKKILEELVTQFKDDEELHNELIKNDILQQENIDLLKTSLEDINLDKITDEINIKLTVNKKKLSNIEFEIPESIKFETGLSENKIETNIIINGSEENKVQIIIENENSSDKTLYKIITNIYGQDVIQNTITLNIDYEGLEKLEEVNENMTLEFEINELKCECLANNKVTFETDGVEIKDFDEDELYLFNENNITENEAVIESIRSEIEKIFFDISGENEDSYETAESFNSAFEKYKGSEVTGTNVTQLVLEAGSVNSSNNIKHKILDIVLNGVSKEVVSFNLNDIQNTKTYIVAFKKDEDGYIYRIAIKENDD